MSAAKIETKVCISCNRALPPSEEGSTTFPCPICGAEIVRCAKCRRFANRYKCVACGFEGP